jgi:Zn-finger nucleic acid-binding protein
MVIDRCPVCRGFWVDRGELEHVLEHGIQRMAELNAQATAAEQGMDHCMNQSAARLTCPRDGACLIEMTDLRQGHIRYDMCPTCGGIFFDAGELTDLSAHTLAERVRGLVRRLRR